MDLFTWIFRRPMPKPTSTVVQWAEEKVLTLRQGDATLDKLFILLIFGVSRFAVPESCSWWKTRKPDPLADYKTDAALFELTCYTMAHLYLYMTAAIPSNRDTVHNFLLRKLRSRTLFRLNNGHPLPSTLLTCRCDGYIEMALSGRDVEDCRKALVNLILTTQGNQWNVNLYVGSIPPIVVTDVFTRFELDIAVAAWETHILPTILKGAKETILEMQSLSQH